MWQIAAAFSLASGLYSGVQYRKAGKAALAEARAQAAEIRKQKFDVALIASQQHENRMEQFKDLVATNEAYAAFMNRSGRSLQALQKAEERRYGKDVDRIRSQEAKEKQKLDAEADALIARGQATNKAYRSAARGSMFNAVANTAMISVPSSSRSSSKSNAGSSMNKSSLLSHQSPKIGMQSGEVF